MTLAALAVALSVVLAFAFAAAARSRARIRDQAERAYVLVRVGPTRRRRDVTAFNERSGP